MGDSRVRITKLEFVDTRFPTSLEKHGSDAMHKDPDYSAAYAILSTNKESLKGYGIAFTLGRGTEIIIKAMESIKHKFEGVFLDDIINRFGEFWHEIVTESQIRWLGPEKCVVHMATGGILNAVWDLWAKVEGKPVWKLLVDMDPERIVSLIDFSYIQDFLTKEDALNILRAGQEGKDDREGQMRETGFPAYTTSAGWLGYTDEKVEKLLREAMANGFRKFKIKIGGNVEEDKRRMQLFRKIGGYDITVMTDANQIWSVKEAIDWMIQLAPYKPYWIEEPTHPDDILGHAEIAKALKPYGILVVTGEHCANRIMFKQFLQSGGMECCQLDSCRLCSVNECLAVMLMAAKAKVPICPHGGGIGLCEYIQHLCFFDYICISKTHEGRVCEYSAHLHEHFKDPLVIKNGAYQVPLAPGHSSEMLKESVNSHRYPDGSVWQRLIAEGKVPKPIGYDS